MDLFLKVGRKGKGQRAKTSGGPWTYQCHPFCFVFSVFHVNWQMLLACICLLACLYASVEQSGREVRYQLS